MSHLFHKAAASIAAAWLGAFSLGQQFSVVSLAPTYYQSEARGINSAGQCVGSAYATSDSPVHAFVFSDGTGLAELPNSPGSPGAEAWSINNLGQVAGSANDGGGNGAPLLWTNGSVSVIDPNLPGAIRSTAITDSGEVVLSLWSSYPGGPTYVSSGGTTLNLPPLNGTTKGAALGGNSAGLIVGRSDTSSQSFATGWIDHVPFRLSSTLDLREADAVNAFGDIAGWGVNAGQVVPYLRDSNGVVTFLPSLTGGIAVRPRGINAARVVVGSIEFVDQARGTFEYRGWIWDATHGVRDLSVAAGLPTGWRISDARGINDSGQIVGSMVGPDGMYRGVRLDPVPEPASLVAVAFGLGFIRTRKRISRIPRA